MCEGGMGHAICGMDEEQGMLLVAWVRHWDCFTCFG